MPSPMHSLASSWIIFRVGTEALSLPPCVMVGLGKGEGLENLFKPLLPVLDLTESFWQRRACVPERLLYCTRIL